MPTTPKSALFQKLPSTDELLQQPAIQGLVAREGHTSVAESIRVVIARLRQEIAAARLDQNSLDLALAALPAAIERQLRQSLRYSLRHVINATGVILHTNLGRAPLLPAALDHMRETASTYSNLEFDLATGERGQRDIHVDRLFQELLAEAVAAERASTERVGTGASPVQAERSSAPISTIVVNNNAAAVLLALNSLAEHAEVIVSRGELVEIGGSFRIPDVMSKSQATLREVGTTNRTRLADYEQAINDRTRLLLRVHRSNFAITGFTGQPALPELVALARRRNLPLMEDLGSGALFDLRSIGIAEPGVLDSLRAGVDIVTYSGDKLLGGPQAGLITGRAGLVARMRSNSLFRALRADKLTYAALEATLLAYVKQDHNAIPTLRMMRLSKDEIARRAEALIEQIKELQPDVGRERERQPDLSRKAAQECSPRRKPWDQSAANTSPKGAKEELRSTLLSAATEDEYKPAASAAEVKPVTSKSDASHGMLNLELRDGESVIGGGAAPTAVLPTRLIALTHRNLSADELSARLRCSDPPVIARVEEARVLLDLRTVFPEQDKQVAEILSSLA